MMKLIKFNGTYNTFNVLFGDYFERRIRMARRKETHSINKALLMEKMEQSGVTVSDLAEEIGISDVLLYYKLDALRPLYLGEVVIICKVLGISDFREVSAIFNIGM